MDFRVITVAECMVQQNILFGGQIATRDQIEIVDDPHANKKKEPITCIN